MNVFPLLVWPYARTVQLKPSRKREMRGRAVLVNRACCVVSGEWTWSKEKTCFFAFGVVGVATAAEDPEVAGAAEDASIATLV